MLSSAKYNKIHVPPSHLSLENQVPFLALPDANYYRCGAMETYSTIFFALLFAEVLRRCYLVLLYAFTGPLSKVPGPFLSKFTKLPWAIELIKGTHLNTIGPLFEKYNTEILRIGK